MKALLLSGYDASSHRYWRESLQTCLGEIEWSCLSLSPRYFNWRMRGNGLWWSQDPRSRAHLHSEYDICIATSMVDLATLRGLVPELCALPTILYFHENQFVYPRSTAALAQVSRDLEPKMVQMYSALAADYLCFNSDYNRHSFLSGLGDMLAEFPDHVPKGIVERLAAKSACLPVPIAPPPAVMREPVQERSFVWNHRWEYDKGPERLLAFIDAMPTDGDFTFHIVGQSFRQVPDAFARIRALLTDRNWLGAWGFIEDSAQYRQLLAASRFVISTSQHDFQGLSVLEAVALGCVPILPDRLAYREIFDDVYRYQCDANIACEASAMAAKTLAFIDQSPPAPEVSAFYQERLAPAYRQCFSNVCARKNTLARL